MAILQRENIALVVSWNAYYSGHRYLVDLGRGARTDGGGGGSGGCRNNTYRVCGPRCTALTRCVRPTPWARSEPRRGRLRFR